MSREPKRIQESVRGSSKLIVYITVAAVIAAVIISYIFIANIIRERKEGERLAKIQSSKKEEESLMIEIGTVKNGEDAESVSTQMGKTVEESNKENTEQTSPSVSPAVPRENISTQNNVKETANENKTSEASTSETKVEKTTKEINFAMPVEGEIVRGFAKDNLVYSETLQEWIVHQAIDIKANSRDVVKTAADGTVIAIKNDPRYGLTVIIEHDGGFKTVYSNLLTAEFVVEGEQVKQGQTLGTVGSSATFEIADEPHLHFEMLKDSVYVDPSIYIK